MKNMKTRLNIFFIAISVYFLARECYSKKYTIERTVKLQNKYRINCTNNSYTIAHITATNTNQKQKNDVIHYLFTTVGRPTIVIKHVTEDTNVTINNTAICQQNGSGFHFYPNNSDISGIVITKVFKYIDSDDTVNLDNYRNSKSIGDDVMKKFQWQVVDVNNDNVNFKATSNSTDGSLYFSANVQTKLENTEDLPRNPVSANITEFTFSMESLQHNETHTRYAVEVMFFSTGKKAGAGTFATKKYIDDEYTPGIFEIWSIKFPLFAGHDMFSSWKPVAFNSKERSRKTQSLVNNFNLNGKLNLEGQLVATAKSDVYTIVDKLDEIHYYKMNTTFGISKDGCYTNNPYTSWTGMVGYYKPTSDSISSMVIIVITIGVGAPAVFILIGILVTLVRKIRLRRKGYEQIN